MDRDYIGQVESLLQSALVCIMSYLFLSDCELLPGNVLHKDVRELAGILDFTTDEITYLCRHQSPFKFFLDQWCKREGSKATLERLHEALVELQRPDLAELIQKTIESKTILFK